jgi:hypothetical protein
VRTLGTPSFRQMRAHKLLALSLALWAAALLGVAGQSDAECAGELQAAATFGNCTTNACPDSCAIALGQVRARLGGRHRRHSRQPGTTAASPARPPHGRCCPLPSCRFP